jgi:predicted NUDIX family NTP pyrophosphohydrolase
MPHQERELAPRNPGSAGLLLYRRTPDGLRVLIAHPGGPYFAQKDLGAWTIPKGLINPDEDPRDAALREFTEEVGWRPQCDASELIDLGETKLRSGKRVTAFALRTDEPEADIMARFSPGVFALEWPPRSGQLQDFPEVDLIAFVTPEEAAERLNPAQAVFIERLILLSAAGHC